MYKCINFLIHRTLSHYYKDTLLKTIAIIAFLASLSLSHLFAQDTTTPPTTSLQTTESSPIKFAYNFDFDFLLDNLEASEPFWPTRTLFAGRLMPQIGINFYGQNLMLGGYLINNMGEKYPTQGGITLFYNFTHNDLKGYFGIFPKKYWMNGGGGYNKEYSNLFFRDDFLFFNPVSNGVLLQYSPKKYDLKAELLIDWYGGNLQKRIDEFLIQAFVRKNFFDKKLFVGGALLLDHFKNTEVLNPHGSLDTYLLDRFYYQIFIGTDLTHATPIALDVLELKLSNLASLERKRHISTGLDPFSNMQGGQLDFQFQYKGFGLANSLYFGAPQYKYLSEYGEDFYRGLPFYHSAFYDRAEFYYEYKNAYLTGRFSVIFHFTKEGIANQEMLTISLDTHKLLGG